MRRTQSLFRFPSYLNAHATFNWQFFLNILIAPTMVSSVLMIMNYQQRQNFVANKSNSMLFKNLMPQDQEQEPTRAFRK